MRKIMKYIVRDIIRSKFLFFYTGTIFFLTIGISYLNRDDTKTIITTLNLIIYLIPLVNILYVSLHYYNSKEFIETLLTYPVRRRQIFLAEYFSLMFALSISFIIGIIVPFTPLGTAIGLAPIALKYIFMIFGVTFLYCIVASYAKKIYIKKYKEWI